MVKNRGRGREVFEPQTVRQEEEDIAESALSVLQRSDQTVLTSDRETDGRTERQADTDRKR